MWLVIMQENGEAMLGEKMEVLMMKVGTKPFVTTVVAPQNTDVVLVAFLVATKLFGVV